MSSKGIKRGCLRGAVAPLYKTLPLPLDKGKGIKGIGLVNNLIIWYHYLALGRSFEKKLAEAGIIVVGGIYVYINTRRIDGNLEDIIRVVFRYLSSSCITF